MKNLRRVVSRLGLAAGVAGLIQIAYAADFVITDDAEWDAGVKQSVNNDAPNNHQIQISTTASTFPVLWVANAGEHTMSKVDTDTDCEVARYKTWFGPVSNFAWGGPAPSRTAVDGDGNVFVANRHFDNRPVAVLKVLLEGGIDRNGNGVIDTSSDDNGNCIIEPSEMFELTDTNGNGTLDDAELLDERVAFAVQIPNTTGHLGRSLCIAPDGNIWAGTYSTNAAYYELSPVDGSLLTGPITTGGRTNYGCVVDQDGILWSAALGSHMNVVDTNTNTYLGFVPTSSNYGIAHANGKVYLGRAGGPYDTWDPDTGAGEPDGNPLTGTYTNLNTVSSSLGVGADGDQNLVQGDNPIRKFSGADNSMIWETPNPNNGFDTRGVVADANNNIWAINLGGNNVTKFRGTDGQFLATVPLGHSPYTYSDATGIGFQLSNPNGTFVGILDAGAPGAPWDRVSWNNEPEGAEPAGTSISLEARAADNIVDLPLNPYMPLTNGTPGLGKVGQYLQVKATLTPTDQGVSPVLADIVASTLEDAPSCDQDGDEDVDRNDIRIITLARNTQVPPGDPRDIDQSGIVDVNDARQCAVQCTRPRCAAEALP